MAFFTAFLASGLPWISHHFKSNPPLEGPDSHSSWSGWIRVCTWALTHLLYMELTRQAEEAVLSIFLKHHLDDVIKMTCTAVCFAYSQHLPWWTLLFPQTPAVLIKGKWSILKSQVSVSINVIYAARYKVSHLFTLRCYECICVSLVDTAQCSKTGILPFKSCFTTGLGKLRFSGSV